jgi:hypothetical protein
MSNLDRPDEWGDDNTVIGPTPKRMGSRNTIVGAVDGSTSTVFNKGGTAVGAGARADSSSVAIGSRAGAGNPALLLEMLERLQTAVADDPTAERAVTELSAAVQQPTLDRARIKTLWTGIQAAITVGEGAVLVAQIAPVLAHLL